MKCFDVSAWSTWRRLILTLYSITMISLPGIYAQVTTGDIRGIITDESENPLASVEVMVRGPSLPGIMGTITNEYGLFIIKAIPPGQYRVEIKHLSYQETQFKEVDVLLGRSTTLGEIKLKEKTIEIEEVVYKWERPVLDMTSTTLGGYIDPLQLNTLPIERDYKSVLTLLPQSNTSYYGDHANMLGASGSDNVYYIDGINVTDPYQSHGGMILPFNFIKGIEVKQGGYEAEYGKAIGGIVNVVTPSGSNEFKANVFSYFTGDVLTGSQKNDSLIPRDIQGFANYDFGFSVGGPIIKDKFWYFLAYNPIFENQDIKVPGFEARKDSKTIHAYAAKLNWIALNNTRFMFTVIGNQSKHSQVGYPSSPASGLAVKNIDVVLADINNGGINLALDVKKNTKSGVLFSGSLGFNSWNDHVRGQTDIGRTEPFYADDVVDSLSGGWGDENMPNYQRMNLVITCDWGWKKHDFLAGVETEILRSEFNWLSHEQGWIFRFQSNYYWAILLKAQGVSLNIVPGIFVQDSWQLSSKLRINYGLRWDAQFMGGPNAVANLNITDQLQPRVGIIYHPGNSGRFKLFGHFGRVYTQFPMYCIADKTLPLDNPIYEYDSDPRTPGSIIVDTFYHMYSDAPNQYIDPGKIKGEFSDEFLIGYEMKLTQDLRFGINGTYKELKNALANGIPADSDSLFIGNPGSGILDFLPAYNRKYSSIELTVGTNNINRFNFFTSYVLSVNKGNYTGFYDQDNLSPNPGNNGALQEEAQDTNSYGYMPNDHRHVFKINASYNFNFGLTVGTSFWIMSGAPLNELVPSSFGLGRYVNLVERGKAGRLPTTWDLNVRLTYDLMISTVQSKIFLDVLHVGNPRKAVQKDQVRFQDYEMTDPNLNYGNVIQYQPPMMVRLGISIDI